MSTCTRWLPSFLGIVTIASIAAACSEGSLEDQRAATARDSAGIEIVENAVPMWDSTGVPWRLADTPRVSIGVAEGEEAYQLFRVRMALRLTNGSIVVGNAGTSEVRFFTGDGEFVRSVGGSGGGPGEFGMSNLFLWQLPSGLIAVADEGNGRLNLFDINGELRGSVMLEPHPESPRSFLSGVFEDGSWLAYAAEGGGRTVGDPGEVVSNYDFIHMRYSDTGELLSELARTDERLRMVFRSSGVEMHPYIPFAPQEMARAAGEHLVVMDGTTAEISVRALDGTIARLIRWTPQSRVLVETVWNEYKRWSLSTIREDRIRRLYEDYYDSEIPLPELVPLADRILCDSGRNLWVGRYRIKLDDPRTWDVFDARGVWLGHVETPPDMTVLQIGEDFVVLNHRDEMGVERVVLYDLVKGGDSEGSGSDSL